MNGRFQIQGDKNWILPKEMNANRFFWGLSLAGNLVKTTLVPLWDRMEGAWLWTQMVAVCTNSMDWKQIVFSFAVSRKGIVHVRLSL